MFTKFSHLAFDVQKPTLVWDGDCSFCQYWALRWQNLIDHNKVDFVTYQKIKDEVADVPVWAFRESVRLIETNGRLRNGPEAVYKTLCFSGNWKWLFPMYIRSRFFRYISDHTYWMIATNRKFMFTITKLLWGRNPSKPRPYWLVYLLALAISIITVQLL